MVNLCVTKVAMFFDSQSFILDDFMILAADSIFFHTSEYLALDHQVSIKKNLLLFRKMLV